MSKDPKSRGSRGGVQFLRLGQRKQTLLELLFIAYSFQALKAGYVR
jgi:hypothetical protein